MMADGFKERYARHMEGRNGGDAISRTCLVVALVLLVLSFFVVGASPFFYVLLLVAGIAAAVYAAFRMNSRDVAKRRLENESFLQLFNRSGRDARKREPRQGRGGARPQQRRKAQQARQGGAGDAGPRRESRGSAEDDGREGGAARSVPEKVTVACDSCGQKLNVPARKGNIRITCPKCSNQFTMFT